MAAFVLGVERCCVCGEEMGETDRVRVSRPIPDTTVSGSEMIPGAIFKDEIWCRRCCCGRAVFA